MSLNVPFEKRVEIKGKAEERRLAETDLKVGTIDLNADSTVAAAWEGRHCRSVETVWHAQESSKREKALHKVKRKQQASGRPIKGEHSNRTLWAYVHNLDDSLAWQIAAAVVAWAVVLGLQVLVFEHLRPYRPVRGLSWSRRTNRKRSYWLRGLVLRHVRDLALREGILVVERNPAWTSQACPKCHRLAERFSPSGTGYPSRLHCGHCGWSGDANVAAALNLKLKWDRTFRYPTAAERKAAEPRRARKGGATANPETVPTAA
jgi:transposase